MHGLQTLSDAAKAKDSKKRIAQGPSQCAAPTQLVPFKLPEIHSESFTKYKNELDIDRLKQPLRENYVEKFHHLLCWEEKEHDDLLKQRYMHASTIAICHNIVLSWQIDCII